MSLWKEIFSRKKVYWVCVILTVLLAYGFTLTHFSIGVDDESFSMYYGSGGAAMIAQGRWQGVVLNSILKWGDFYPVWVELLGVISMALGVTILVFLFGKASDGAFGDAAATVFSCVTISFPYIPRLFVFSNAAAGVGVILALTALICLILYRALERGFKWYTYPAVGLILLTQVCMEYLFSMVLTVFFMMWFLKKTVSSSPDDWGGWKRFIFSTALLAVTVVAAYFLNSVIAGAFQVHVFGTVIGSYASNSFIVYNFDSTLPSQFLNYFLGFIKQLVEEAKQSFTGEIILFSILVFFAASIFAAIKRKSFMPLLLGLAVFASTFLINFVSGNLYLSGRILWTECILVGFSCALLVCFCIKKPYIKRIVAFMLSFVVFFQSKDCTEFFFNDYQRYQLDKQMTQELAQDILAAADCRSTEYLDGSTSQLTKPVIFIGIPRPYNIDHLGDDVMGWSIYYWDRVWSTDTELSSPRIYNLMEIEGYKFDAPAFINVGEVRNRSTQLSIWPAEGSIKEFDEYVLVKIGAPLYEYEYIQQDVGSFMAQHVGDETLTNFWLDYCAVENGMVSMYGWGYYNGVSSRETRVSICLISENDQYIIRVPQSQRVDVANAFQDADHLYAGFSFGNFSVSYLVPGTYTVGILIEAEGLSSIIVTDSVVEA